jgi:Kef-type K+ transport system membrane component KefB
MTVSLPGSHEALKRRIELGLVSAAALSIAALPAPRSFLWTRLSMSRRLSAVTGEADEPDLLVAIVLLAVATTLGRGHSDGATIASLAKAAVYTLFSIVAVPRGVRCLDRYVAHASLSERHFVASLLVLLVGLAWMTQRLGAHPAFAAFELAAAMPESGALTTSVKRILEDMVETVAIPVIFVGIGLHVDVTLLHRPAAFILLGITLFGGIACKYVGCLAATRESPWSRCFALVRSTGERLPAAMIVLWGGLQAGLFTSEVFTRMALAIILGALLSTELAHRPFDQSQSKLPRTASLEGS